MQPPSPSQLDRAIARLLQGNDSRPPAYSTSAIASQRLVRLLSDKLEIETELIEDGGVVYCRMRRAGATLSAGSGETAELAIARAAANLSPAILGAPLERPSRPSDGASIAARHHRHRARPTTVPCEICGAPMRPPPVGIERRVCNPCSYRRLMDAARSRHAPNGSENR
jgi:hypothetical protein